MVAFTYSIFYFVNHSVSLANVTLRPESFQECRVSMVRYQPFCFLSFVYLFFIHRFVHIILVVYHSHMHVFISMLLVRKL